LISASTRPAAVPSWAADVLAGAAGVLAGADVTGGALAVPVPLVWCGDGEREDPEGVGLVPVWCARASAWRGGTVTTAGATATEISSGLAAQADVSAASHPATVLPLAAAACPDAWLAENTPRAR
jgi:hypothetical protein